MLVPAPASIDAAVAAPGAAAAVAADGAGADRELVARLRRGEARAFDAVWARHHQRIWSFLLRLSGRRDLADDLFQETWLRLARHAPRLDEDTDLAAWLYTVARNCFRSYRRWVLVDRDRLRELGFAVAAHPDVETPYDRARAGEDGRRLERALGALAPSDREVLLLVCVEGLEHERVAAMLGLRPDALRQRLSRARARLAARLGSTVPRRAGPRADADVES